MRKKYVPAPLPPRPDDTGEARAYRAENEATLQWLKKQNSLTSLLTETMSNIAEARKYDQFGDDLEEAFTRRKKH